jgi:hypothetical protein
LVGKGDDRIGIRNIELAVKQRHAEGRIEPRYERPPYFGDAIAILVTQERYSIGAGDIRPGLALEQVHDPPSKVEALIRLGRRIAFCDQDIATGQHMRPAGMIEPTGKLIDGKA